MGIIIDLKKCTGCNMCVPICPVGVLSIVDMKAQVKEGCIDCGACVDICTFRAIEIEDNGTAKKD